MSQQVLKEALQPKDKVYLKKITEMTTLEKIQKKVVMPYSLKHYFSSYSHEFSRFDYSKKIKLLQSVVQNGFSTYDLSEGFRIPRATNYSHDHMQKELVRYIAFVLYHKPDNYIVSKYYEGLPDSEVAKDLDAFLLSEDPYEDFKSMFKEKFDIAL